ncbi:MAG: hypothetical protein IPM79_23960 [Polyangiaceae bacterium]|nr:hypothetical protein [Polyangiaceae bacterium]
MAQVPLSGSKTKKPGSPSVLAMYTFTPQSASWLLAHPTGQHPSPLAHAVVGLPTQTPASQTSKVVQTLPSSQAPPSF